MSNYEYKVKRENPNDEFVLIGDWAISSGEKISEGDYLCTLESSKNSYEVEATKDGYIHYQASEGDKLDVGTLLFVITDSETHEWEDKKKKAETGETKVTRKAQKLINDYNIDINIFLQNKPEKISEKLVKDYIEKNNLKSNDDLNSQESININHTDEELSSAKAFEVHYMSQNRDIIYSKVTKEIDYMLIKNLQESHKGLSIGEAVSFATIDAIKKFPYINACFTQNKIRKYNDYNLGLAINIGKGLKVPVIKNFASLTLSEVSNQFKEIAMNYVRDELKGADMIDGTFTITDLSSLGVKDFMPVVNKDQGSILGICAVSKHSETFNITLGFDHRIIDGMYAAQFLNAIEKNLKKLQ
jgi:pyruvate/2-oxoglutarate dehydrogenase complex dihydrolipoamide acyltransferase (E2) component